MAEFTIPPFLSEGCDVDSIHKRMIDMLPTDIDKTEGGFPWDFTRPTAMIAAELLEYYAVELVKVMFPQFSYGDYLDQIAEMVGITRRSPTFASVELEIVGDPGLTIHAGTVFATEFSEEVPSLEFATSADVTILLNGKCTVSAVAVESGTESNVEAGTIVMMSTPLVGIETIVNHGRAFGGTDAEDDDSLRARILTVCQSTNNSFTGNYADYKRWGEEVPGIGTVLVIPAGDDKEGVKLVCLDANGDGASNELLAEVYKHIMRPDNPYERLAPINARLYVTAPEKLEISYDANVILKDGYTLEEVLESFRSNIEAYYDACVLDKVVRYNRVQAVLISTEGVEDFSSLKVNGGTANIPFTEGEYPATKNISFNDELEQEAPMI